MLVDARNGIVEQSRRHAYLSSLLGIRHLIACVNKMDLVDWDEDRFREIEAEFRALAERLGVPDARVIPISALHGDNVVEASTHTPWYDGAPLLRHLETARDRARTATSTMVRLPVQWVIRPRARARRLPRLRRPDGRGHAAAGRRGRRAARGRAHDGRAHRHARRPGSRRPSRRCR